MDDTANLFVPTAQAERIIQKLSAPRQPFERGADPEVAPLLPGYAFGIRLMAAITPIDRGGPLDFTIERPEGMRGWILNLTVKGRGRVFGNSSEAFDVGPGDLLLLPPGAIHDYGRHPEARSWWHRWVYFQPRAFWVAWLSWRQSRNGVFVLRRQDDDIFQEQSRLFAEIAGWSVLADHLSVELSMNLLERLILLCAKQNQTSIMTEDFDERLALACKFMADNLHRALSVEDVAQQVHLSPSRLAHLFSRKYGISIMRWREQQRIQFASQILRMTTTPIKQIAAQAGYEDPLYFSRVFRKQTGLSPMAYRRRNAELGSGEGVIGRAHEEET